MATPRPVKRDGIRFAAADGKSHRYLNVAVPEGQPLIESLCDSCGYGYSECIIRGWSVCGECRIEFAMSVAEWLEDQGIPMGVRPVRRCEEQWSYKSNVVSCRLNRAVSNRRNQ